ncbi:MAG: lipase [Sphingobacteriales bacterium]|nr:lipase [Sphingobacteriales bacterium]
MRIKVRIIAAILMLAVISPSCKKAKSIEEISLAAEDKLNIAYGENSKQVLDLYLPEKRNESTKVVMLIHGGFWTGGDKSDLSMYVKTLQNSGYAVANMNYRLATVPENNIHPAQINDITKAINFLSSKSAEWHVSANRFGLIGASAGAHLALLYTYAYNTDDKVKTVISIAGPTNLTDSRNLTEVQKLIIANFLGKTQQQDPALYIAASPITHVSASSKATLLIHGKEDLVVPYQQATDLKAKLDLFNVPNEFYLVEGVGHENVVSPANSVAALGKVLTWLDTYIK